MFKWGTWFSLYQIQSWNTKAKAKTNIKELMMYLENQFRYTATPNPMMRIEAETVRRKNRNTNSRV